MLPLFRFNLRFMKEMHNGRCGKMFKRKFAEYVISAEIIGRGNMPVCDITFAASGKDHFPACVVSMVNNQRFMSSFSSLNGSY